MANAWYQPNDGSWRCRHGKNQDLLTAAIADSEPLDKIVYELISAVGSTNSDLADFNPAASYLAGLNKRFGTREMASAHVANTFLGQKNQCLQCHDRFGDESTSLADTQQSFYEFHSFFAQLRFEPPSEGQTGQLYVVNRNYLPLGNEGRVEAALKYTDGKGQQHEAFPKLGETVTGTNGFVEKVDRRSTLANLIATSTEFRESMVDHVWASMMNLPLSGIDGNIDPQMVQLRKDLGEQFAANGFELSWLVETIASSEAFAVGVGTEEQLASNNPFLGTPPVFNVFYSRIENRRSAIQSLAIVAKAYSSGDVQQALSAGLLARVDNSISDTPRYILPFVPTKDSEWATSPRITQQLELIVASQMAADKKIEHMIQAALGRPARKQEIEQALIILENGKDQRTALQDVWWSLLNSVDYRTPLNVR